MFWKWHRWKKDETITAAKTDEFELPESGLVAALMVTMNWKNSGTHNNLKPYPHDNITKIEVLGDGTEQIKEYSGNQCQAHFVADHGFMPEGKLSSYGARDQSEEFMIYFGTHLFKNGKFDPDREHLFDLEQFKDVKLEVTNDATSTNFDTSDLTMDLDILTLQEAPAVPAKYMKTYEFKNFTPEKDAWNKVITLPTRDKIRRIMAVMVRDRASVTDGHTCKLYELIKEYKLMYKEGSIVVLEEELTSDHRTHRPTQLQRCRTHGECGDTLGRYLDTMLGRQYSTVVSPAYQTAPSAACGLCLDNHNYRLREIIYTTSGAEQYNWMAEGIMFLDSLILDDYTIFGEAEWYDPEKRKPGQIEFTGTKDDGSIGIVLDVPKENLPKA